MEQKSQLKSDNPTKSWYEYIKYKTSSTFGISSGKYLRSIAHDVPMIEKWTSAALLSMLTAVTPDSDTWHHRNQHTLIHTLCTARFYCFINGKVKKEPEKPWIRSKHSKNGQFHIFPRQAANRNSAATGEFHGAEWKSMCRGILLALVITHTCLVFI